MGVNEKKHVLSIKGTSMNNHLIILSFISSFDVYDVIAYTFA